MFGVGGGGAWGGIVIPAAEDFAQKVRQPPARPIPLEFPDYSTSSKRHHLTPNHAKSIRKSIARLRRPGDISEAQLSSLSIDLQKNVPLEHLIPSDRFTQGPFLYEDVLTAALAELQTNNEDAYRELLRLPPLEGRQRPRLSYSRNFFTNLEDMSRYWDTSKDNYYKVPADQAPKVDTKNSVALRDHRSASKDEAGNVKMSDPEWKPDGHSTSKLDGRSDMKEVYTGLRSGNSEQQPPGMRVAAVRNLLKMVVYKFNCRDVDPNYRDCLLFQNIRLPMAQYSVGVNKIPSDMKIARQRVTEGPVMAVHARHEVRSKSRDGLLGPNSDFVGEKFDFFREIGCLLLLASQRSREGKPPRKVTDTDWWATNPRWGGGVTRWGQMSNEIFEDEDPAWSPEERKLQMDKRERDMQNPSLVAAATVAAGVEDVQMRTITADDLIADPERPKKKHRPTSSSFRPGSSSAEDRINGTKSPLIPQGLGDGSKDEYRDGRRVLRIPAVKKKWFQEWANVRPNSSPWDPKIIYKALGKDFETSQGWDDVFLISSVNHHVCLMRMSVHEKYLDWLATGATVDSTDIEKKQDTLYVSRSKWFDLFDVEQRCEFLTGLWRIMSWINRDSTPQSEYDKMDAKKV